MDPEIIQRAGLANYGAMKDNDSPTFAVEVSRSRNENPEITFSAKLVDEIMGATGAWILTRLARHFEKTTRGAKRMRVVVSVILEDDDVRAAMDIPPFTIDLTHRNDARRAAQ